MRASVTALGTVILMLIIATITIHHTRTNIDYYENLSSKDLKLLSSSLRQETLRVKNSKQLSELNTIGDNQPEQQLKSEQLKEKQQTEQKKQERQEYHPDPSNNLNMSFTAKAVSACESGARKSNGTAVLNTHTWTAENPNSSASGAWQFIDSTWIWVAHRELGYTEFNRAKHAPPHVQLEAFHWLWNNGGPHHWNPSKSCWLPMIN